MQGGAEVADELEHPLLGFRGEGLLHIELAQGLADGAILHGFHALPAGLLLRRAVQHLAVEGEVLLLEGLGQEVGGGAEGMPAQVGAPLGRGGRGGELGEGRGVRGLADVQFFDLRPAGLEVGRPVEARGLLLQLGQGALVVGLLWVAQFHAGPGRLGHAGLQVQHHAGPDLGQVCGIPGQLEHLRDVGLVLGADVLRAGVVVQVVVAVGQAQAALVQGAHVPGAVLGVLHDEEAEAAGQALAMELRQRHGQLLRVLQAVDGGEDGLQGGRPALLDGLLVHARGEEVTHLLLDAALGPGVLGAGLVKDLFEDLAVVVAHLGEGAVDGLVCGQRMALQPPAVGEVVEVVAGLHRGVEVGGVDAVGAGLGHQAEGRQAQGEAEGGAEGGCHELTS